MTQTTEWPIFSTTRPITAKMPAQQLKKERSKSDEANIQLAIQALDQGQFRTIRSAARAYSVCHKTLTRRLKGQPSRRDILANSRRLTNLEEEVVTQYITDLQSRGFPPRLSTVEEMANQLLRDREVGPIEKNWAQNFVRRNL